MEHLRDTYLKSNTGRTKQWSKTARWDTLSVKVGSPLLRPVATIFTAWFHLPLVILSLPNPYFSFFILGTWPSLVRTKTTLSIKLQRRYSVSPVRPPRAGGGGGDTEEVEAGRGRKWCRSKERGGERWASSPRPFSFACLSLFSFKSPSSYKSITETVYASTQFPLQWKKTHAGNSVPGSVCDFKTSGAETPHGAVSVDKEDITFLATLFVWAATSISLCWKSQILTTLVRSYLAQQHRIYWFFYGWEGCYDLQQICFVLSLAPCLWDFSLNYHNVHCHHCRWWLW